MLLRLYEFYNASPLQVLDFPLSFSVEIEGSVKDRHLYKRIDLTEMYFLHLELVIRLLLMSKVQFPVLLLLTHQGYLPFDHARSTIQRQVYLKVILH
ncbi:hypothetical protein D9M73_264370 [compost metagenome]